MTVLNIRVPGTAPKEQKIPKPARVRRSGNTVLTTAAGTIGPLVLLAPLVTWGLDYVQAHTTIVFGPGYQDQLMIAIGALIPVLAGMLRMVFVRLAEDRELLRQAILARLAVQGDPFAPHAVPDPALTPGPTGV